MCWTLRLKEVVIPVVNIRDANPLDMINLTVSSALATNKPHRALSRIIEYAQHPPPMHPALVTTVDKSALPLVTLTRTNCSAYALILAIAEAGNLNVVFLEDQIHVKNMNYANSGFMRTHRPSARP